MTPAKKFPQYLAGLIAAGGAFACGTLLGWSAPVQKDIQSGDAYGFPVNNNEFSWVGSLVPLGAALVCIPIGIIVGWIGRKPTMLLLVIPFLIGWILLIFAQNVGMLYAARFLLGVAGGAFGVCAPLYTTEIAQKEIRGILGTFFQLLLVNGVLYSFVVGAFVDVKMLNILCAIIPIIFGITFFFMPETPVYLVKKGRNEDAIKVFNWLRGADYDNSKEMDELKAADAKLKEKKLSIASAFSQRVTQKALSMAVLLMIFQQFSGINAVIFYSTDIFARTDSGISGEMATILIGTINVISTFVSIPIVDRLGRKFLLLFSGVFMTISTFTLGVYFWMVENNQESVQSLGFLAVGSVLVYICTFAVGFGPVPWIMMAELFTEDVKSVAASIAATTNWLSAFFVTTAFLFVRDLIGAGITFMGFSLISLISVIYIIFILPETKGKSMSQIQAELEGIKE